MFPVPRVKICCISSHDEAALAARYGASAVGLVSRMPSGPGPIAEEAIRDIARNIPPGITSVLLTCETSADSIANQQRFCRTSAIQLVDYVAAEALEQLRNDLPGIAVIQVIHVVDESAVDEALELDGKVNAILLDSGNPRAAVKELGGTGRRHDWRISGLIRESVKTPVYLAGGLNPANVREAIDTVQPFGIDVCSGVRTDGPLDEGKLSAFMSEAGVVH